MRKFTASSRDRWFAFILLGLVIISTLALAYAIITGIESLNRVRSYDETVQTLSGALSGNVRTLAMVQREVLRLMVLIESGTTDADKLELQRSFVAQRMQESTINVQRDTLGTQALFDKNRGLVDIWDQTVNPKVLTYIANSDVSDVDRDALLNDLRTLEVDFNQLTSDGEINREREAKNLTSIANTLVNDIVRLIVTLAITLIGFASLSIVTSGVFNHLVRLRAENADRILGLLQETQKLSKVADRISNLVVVTDPQGIIEWVNQAYIERSGFTQKELIGTDLSSYLPDAQVIEKWRTCLQDKQGFTSETRIHTRSGLEYSTLMGVQPSVDDSGALVNFIVVETDISDLKKVESALRLSEQQLRNALEQERELSQMKTRFVTMTSHEFRTPLAIISTTYETLRDFYDRMDVDQRKKRFERISEQIHHLTRMLDDILMINRIQEGKLAINPEQFVLSDFMMRILDEFKAMGIAQTLVCERFQEDVRVVADKMLIRQVITNLLSNAIKYSPPQSTVYVCLEQDVEGIVLRVRDEGIGIPEADQQQMFEAFHRAQNVGNIKGTGLGLSIAKRAIDMHKGTISFSSATDKGTEFTVRLPTNQKRITREVDVLRTTPIG
jgi:PAS domain S-box-containing protein